MPRDQPRETKMQKVADALREPILSGEWRPGHVLPSQKELKEEHGFSIQTARNALKELEGEGLIKIHQGTKSVVLDREPTHLFVVDGPYLLQASDRIAESAIPHVAHRMPPSQDMVAVPPKFAELLGLTPGRHMVQRTITQTQDDQPILISTSYLPIDLASDPAERHQADWHDVEMGQLALVGHDVTVLDHHMRVRMPSRVERTKLNMPNKGVPLIIFAYPCQVLLGERTIPAGVIVLAPSDRVSPHWSRFAPVPGA